MKPHRFSRPDEKVWRHGPTAPIAKGDTVWFFASSRNGIEQECLTGIIGECKVFPTQRKDGEESVAFHILVGMEDWLVDSSRIFEYWEDCDKEARIYAKWCKQLRRVR